MRVCEVVSTGQVTGDDEQHVPALSHRLVVNFPFWEQRCTTKKVAVTFDILTALRSLSTHCQNVQFGLIQKCLDLLWPDWRRQRPQQG
eukprot:5018620-Amphidinium_carterae.1